MAMNSVLFCLAVAGLVGLASSAPAGETQVDLQLVLAADISASMSPQELRLQRSGYVTAFLSRGVATAIQSGLRGQIAVTYVEWGEQHEQFVAVPWMVLSDRRSIDDFARRLAAAPTAHPGAHTALSSALLFSAQLFGSDGLISRRRTIDVTGDGMSDAGPPLAMVRRSLIQDGITINALSVAENQAGPFAAMYGETNADIYAYYRKDVIGGPRAFALRITKPSQFVFALERKLILEIASR